MGLLVFVFQEELTSINNRINLGATAGGESSLHWAVSMPNTDNCSLHSYFVWHTQLISLFNNYNSKRHEHCTKPDTDMNRRFRIMQAHCDVFSPSRVLLSDYLCTVTAHLCIEKASLYFCIMILSLIHREKKLF